MCCVRSSPRGSAIIATDDRCATPRACRTPGAGPALLSIPHDLVVELEPEPALATFELDGPAYAPGPSGTGRTPVEVARPFPCTVAPDRLLD
jgi:hypothetical protein